jgi:hypothetical protein
VNRRVVLRTAFQNDVASQAITYETLLNRAKKSMVRKPFSKSRSMNTPQQAQKKAAINPPKK